MSLDPKDVEASFVSLEAGRVEGTNEVVRVTMTLDVRTWAGGPDDAWEVERAAKYVARMFESARHKTKRRKSRDEKVRA